MHEDLVVLICKWNHEISEEITTVFDDFLLNMEKMQVHLPTGQSKKIQTIIITQELTEKIHQFHKIQAKEFNKIMLTKQMEGYVK